ncbi:MAG: carbohydrate kinase family protein, partial [Candidatus Pacebacteria bacterium]|nr:carbohydrate kinase family protein [Candidatus Paceibacterota bacterium]
FSGGGGTNTAITFAKQGLKTAYYGSVGDDLAGEAIIKDLKSCRVDTSLIQKNLKRPTNHSLILSIPNQDRTIFSYKGASNLVDFKKLNVSAKYFYIAPLSDNLAKSFEFLVDYAYDKGIKVAVNMGQSQLDLPKKKLDKILSKTNILILNKEEASYLSGIPYTQEEKIFKTISSNYPGVFVMTKGSKGLSVFDGVTRYDAGVIESVVVDRTGAGDSFAAGFVSEYMVSGDTLKAIQFGSANATSCLTKWGAKNGLISRESRYKKIKVEKL